MIHLTRITLHELHLPLREPFQISSGTVTTRRIFLTELEDTDGTISWGECVAGEYPNYSPETIDTAWLAIKQWLAPLLMGRRFDTPRDVAPLLNKMVRGHQMAKAALEMPIWNLFALKAGQSLATYIGGTRDKVATGISIGIQTSPDVLVEKVAGYVTEGYQKIKCKIKPGHDVAYVRAVREALGPSAPIMADANSAYTLADLPTFQQLDALDLMMIEQPLAHDDQRRHAVLQRHLNTPLCLDESITSPADAEDFVAGESGRIINIKPGRVGGFASAISIHDICLKNKIPVWCGGMLESGIGRAYNVALAALPNFVLPGDLSPSARYWHEDIVTPEWTMDAAGWVTVPHDQAGLGVLMNRQRVADLTVRQETLPE